MNMSVCITITEKVSVVNSVKLQYCGCFLSSFNPSLDFRSRQREVFFKDRRWFADKNEWVRSFLVSNRRHHHCRSP